MERKEKEKNNVLIEGLNIRSQDVKKEVEKMFV